MQWAPSHMYNTRLVSPTVPEHAAAPRPPSWPFPARGDEEEEVLLISRVVGFRGLLTSPKEMSF